MKKRIVVQPAPKGMNEFFGDTASESRTKPFTAAESAELDTYDAGIREARRLLAASKETATPVETTLILRSGRRVVYIWAKRQWFVESPKVGLVMIAGRGRV